jgi:N-acetylglucosaminyl-diphospho-decaprenol L-rhamnosyltransferase
VAPMTPSSEADARMKLLVVIVNYRVAHLVIECLESVAREINTVPGIHVAVCENGTGDDSADRIQKAIDAQGWGGWCSLTAISPNLGFTGGNNVILRPVVTSKNPPQYILLLNADTVVLPNAFKALVDFMDEHPKVGIAGSRLQAVDGTVQCSAFRFPSPMSEFESGVKLGLVSRLLDRWKTVLPLPSQTSETDWVSGTSMIIRLKVLQDIGLLDEGYYTYFDDVDICLNARRAGWPTWYVAESQVIHLEGQSTGVTHKVLQRRPSYLFEARRRYFLKNHGPMYAAFVDAARISGLGLWRLRTVLTGKKDSTPPYFLTDSIKHSVFLSGFRLRDVQNPMLAKKSVTDKQVIDQRPM